MLNSIEFLSPHLLFLQIKKIGFVSEGTHAQVPGLLAADVNDQDQILLRVKVDDGFFIRVLGQIR